MNETKPEGQPTGDGPAPANPAAGSAAQPGQAGPQPGSQAGSQSGPQAGSQAGPSPAGAPLADQVVELLKAENAELRDRVLRAHAEMDNIRKRTEREKSDAQKYALTKFARDIVGVGDNFQRAIETVPADAAEQVPALKSFLEGVTMTERELINVLERHGIKRIDPKGLPFNPHHHQAVMEQPNPDVPAGTVTQVFQAGYLIEDRVLRPAMVVVARGGMKPVRPVETPGQPGAPAGNGSAEQPANGADSGGGQN